VAEVHRIAGEIALKSPESDAAEADGHFQCALAVARQQQTKSWELRAAMSMARLCAIRASGMRLASFSLRSTAGSMKGLIRAI
jgi:predicted ATPase